MKNNNKNKRCSPSSTATPTHDAAVTSTAPHGRRARRRRSASPALEVAAARPSAWLLGRARVSCCPLPLLAEPLCLRAMIETIWPSCQRLYTAFLSMRLERRSRASHRDGMEGQGVAMRREKTGGARQHRQHAERRPLLFDSTLPQKPAPLAPCTHTTRTPPLSTHHARQHHLPSASSSALKKQQKAI